MNIVIDKNIPFIEGVFEPYASVEYYKGEEITPNVVKDADALVIRTRTKCNETLLKGSSVKLISTATIGLDHIDLEYCSANGIKVCNSAGCNAGGVMQYVFTALYGVAARKGIILPDDVSNASEGSKKVLGVIGVGNVGSRVANFGEYLGFEVMRCDPAKERQQTIDFNNGYIQIKDFKDYYSLEYLLENSDIVTIHTDLNTTSRGMVNGDFLSKMKKGSILINAARGEVAVDEDLLKYREKLSALILDVWNDEPTINRDLVAIADIATPHIAGYSYEGKVNGTVMAVKGVAEFFDIEPLKGFSITPAVRNTNFFSAKGLNQTQINEYFNNIFAIFEDDFNLRSNLDLFEQLRNKYNYRREFYVI